MMEHKVYVVLSHQLNSTTLIVPLSRFSYRHGVQTGRGVMTW